MKSRRAALGAWAALLVLCAAIIARTPFRTDMAAFLPAQAPLAQRVLTAQATSGAASHLLLLGIGGAPPAVLARLSEALAARLRARPEFLDVLNGDDASFAATRDFVFRHRYLLSPETVPAAFTPAGLRAALVDDLGLLGTDLGPLLMQSLAADPTGAALSLAQELAPAGGPAVRDGVWLSADGGQAPLLVHSAAAGFDLDAQQRDLGLIARDYAAAQASVQAGMPGAARARLGVTGPGVFGVHTRDATKRDVSRLSTLAVLGAAGLLLFAYRSPRVLLLGLLPVASGAVAAIAAVSLAFGYVHGVTLGFGVTLIGESLDYAIYLFTQKPAGGSAAGTLAEIWPTLRLGMLTSVAGFAAMLFSSFTGFAQLGLFSITGLVVAAGVTRYVLPQLVPAGFAARPALPVASVMAFVSHHGTALRLALGAAVLAAGALLLTHRGGMWDQDLGRLSPVPAADQALDDRLRQVLGETDTRYFAVLSTGSEQAALQGAAALGDALAGGQAAGALGGYGVPSAILPSDAAQAARRAALPEAPALRAALAQAAVGLPFKPGIFEPFLRDVAATRAAPPLRLQDLPPALGLQVQSMLARDGGSWVVAAPLQGVRDPAAVARAIAPAGLVDLDAESGRLLHSFQRQATALAVIGSAAILVLLVLFLRSARRVARVAAPLAAAVLVTAALLTLGGAKISIFMVVGFLLIVALGSNYCLFFERPQPDAAARGRAVSAIVLANLCTVCAYGLLSASAMPVLHDIGRTVAIGTFLSLLAGAILSRPDDTEAA